MRIILILMLTLISGISAGQVYTLYEDYQTIRDDVPVYKGGTPDAHIKYVLNQIYIGHLPYGTILRIHGGVQVTNDLGYNVGWAVYTRFDEKTGTKDSSGDTFNLSSRNVTPDMHHDVRNFSRVVIVDNESTVFKLAIRAFSSAALSGDKLQVNKSWLQVEVIE